jgi:hypothetical protein
MGESLEMMMTIVSPSGREVLPAESAHRRAKVHLPKFHLQTAALHPESPLLIFSRSRSMIYQKGGLGGLMGWGTHTRPRLEGVARPRGVPHPLTPLRYLFAPVFFIKYKINLHGFSA